MSNRVREQRQRRGWSQAELAERTGVSRTAVSAIEGQRLVPSVAAALALARALETSVEELFCATSGEAASEGPAWAWAPPQERWRYWQAEVGGRVFCYPSERTGEINPPHDGIAEASGSAREVVKRASETLVLASCDPAAGLLATEYQRQTGLRMIVLTRSSGEALELLRRGLVHVAGIHFANAEATDANEAAARARLNSGFQLLRAAEWQEGVAVASGRSARTVTGLLRSHPRWVGREPGSAARTLQDDLLPESRTVERCASDHRGVAAAIRGGWADAGVCVRLVSEEAGLQFLSVRQESHDLCLQPAYAHDRRIQSLVLLLQSAAFRQLTGELPGYDSRHTGEMRECK